MSERDYERAMQTTRNDNLWIERHRGNMNQDEVRRRLRLELPYHPFYDGASDEVIEEAVERIVRKTCYNKCSIFKVV